MRMWWIFILTGIVLVPAYALESQIRLGIVKHDRGESVAPVYEGFFRTEDGRIFASFGYLNKNHQETIDIPIGPDNKITPGPDDRGQPSHFLARRHTGIFAFELPPNVQDGEIKWVLSIRGESWEIPVNLDNEYLITAFRADTGRTPGNVPPTVKFSPNGVESFGPAGMTVAMSAEVGAPLDLEVWVTDDGLGSVGEPALEILWSKFRGPGNVTFSDSKPTIESNGQSHTTAVFDKSGDYTLYLRASDGSNTSFQCCWTNAYLQVEVTN